MVLILCCSNLPAKPAEEAQKHRQQYEEMVAQAKKRGKERTFVGNCPSVRPSGLSHTSERMIAELKEAQKRKKQLEDRCKLEESIGTAVQTWNQDILPNWSTM